MPKKGKSENVQVILRVRPLNKKEAGRGDANAVKVHLSENAVSVAGSGVDDRLWAFDSVYTNAFSQKDVYLQSIHPVVETVLSGYNATIFAYGQSGTGKTYSMCGNLDVHEEQGIIPHALNHIFEYIKDSQNEMMEYNVFASFVELYNGKCRDLCVDGHLNLELKENSQKLFFVKDLSMHEVRNMRSAMALMEDGLTRREVKSTELNSDSSRSHSLFTLYVRTWDKEQDLRTEAKLNLVDLAGSERQKASGASGETLKEGTNINLSLTALGTVIDCLVKTKPHIPYRSSPLTMLLKDGLGGNSRTVIVGTIGPSDQASHESVSTLRFIDRAKQIKNKPKVQMDPKDAQISELLEVVKKLRRQLGLDEEGEGDEDEDSDLRAKRKGSAVRLFDDEMEALRRRIEELEVQVEMSSETVLSAESKEREFQAKLEKAREEFKERQEELQCKVSELEDSRELLNMTNQENERALHSLESLCISFLTQIDKDGVWTSTVHLDPNASPKKHGPQPPDVEDIGRGFKMVVGKDIDMKLHALSKRSSFAFNHGHSASLSLPPGAPKNTSSGVFGPTVTSPTSGANAASPTSGSGDSESDAGALRSPQPPSIAPPQGASPAAALHQSRLEPTATPVPDGESDVGGGSDNNEEEDPLGPAPKKKDKKKKDKKKKDKKSKGPKQGVNELPSKLVDEILAKSELTGDTKIRNVIDAILAKQREYTSQLQQKRLEDLASGSAGGRAAAAPEMMAAVEELNEAIASANDSISAQRQQLAKARGVAEKKMNEVSQMKDHIDSLREELNTQHSQHAAELALQQDRLVQQHSKKMEQLMNKQAKALVKERKLRETVQHKLDKHLEKYSNLEQDYDVKVMELESMTRDFEELKLESLRRYKEQMSFQGNFSSVGGPPPSSPTGDTTSHTQMMAQLRQAVVNDDSTSEAKLDRLRLVVEKTKGGGRKESQMMMPRSAPETLQIPSLPNVPHSPNAASPASFSRNFLDVGPNVGHRPGFL